MATIQGVYVALFGRPADPTGLNYFNSVTNNGADLSAIGDLASTAEYQARFAGKSSAEIITSIYESLFDRLPEQAGLDFFVAALANGTFTINNIAIAILDGAQGDDLTLVNKKIAAADLFTAAIDTPDEIASYQGTEAGQSGINYLEAVTATSADVDSAAAQSAVDLLPAPAGQTFTLTEGVDVATANVFNAPRGFTPGGTDQINTLDDDDVLTGTGSNPTLNFSFVTDADTGDNNIVPTLNDIETVNVNVRGSTAGELDLQNASGVQNINITGLDDSQVFGFDNIQDAAGSGSGINIGINDLNDDDGRLNFLFDDDAVEGTSDVANITYDDSDLSVLQVEEEDAEEGIETINLAVSSGSSSIDTLISEDLQTLNVTGDENIRIGSTAPVTNGGVVEANVALAGFNNVAGSFSNYNGALNTGNQTVHFGGEVVATQDDTSGVDVNFTATGGTGNDTFRFVSGFDAGDTIDGGEGTNTVGVFASVAEGTVSNFQSLEVRDIASANNIITVDTSIFTGLENILVRNEGNDGAVPLNTPTGADTTINLDDVSSTIATNGIEILHGTSVNNGITDLTLNVDLDDASGSSDTAAFEISDAQNADPRFSFVLNVDGENAAGSEDAGGVENITLTDSDSESNVVHLLNEAEHTGTITISGGSDGEFFSLDTDGNSGSGLLALDSSTTATPVDGQFIQDSSLTAGITRLGAATIDASLSVSDVLVRVDTNDASATGAQTITMGEGDDTVVFDAIAGATQSTAGLTISDTVNGGDGNDRLALDGNGTSVNISASEWTNVSNFETVHLVGNGVADNNAQNMMNAYNLTLTNDFIDDNGGDLIAIVNDNGGGTGIINVGANDGVTIDARTLTADNSFSYDGQEAAVFGGGAGDDTVDTADRFILADPNINGSAIIDGGAIVNETTPGANILAGTNVGTNDGTAANSDVLEVRNAAVITIGDLAQTSNLGTIELTNDSAVDQAVLLQLDNATVDRLVNTTSTADGTNTTTIGQTAEVLTITAFDNPNLVTASSVLTLDTTNLTNAALQLNVTGAGGNDDINGGAGDDTITGAGGQDTITTGAGNDTVNIDAAISAVVAGATLADAAANTDIVDDFNFDNDVFDVAAVPANIIAEANGAISAATFVANVSALLTTAAGDAQIITANAGDLNGRSWLVEDIAGAGTLDVGDTLVEITGFTGTIDVADFV